MMATMAKLRCEVLSVKGLKGYASEDVSTLKAVSCHVLFRGHVSSSAPTPLQPSSHLLELNHAASFTLNEGRDTNNEEEEEDFQLTVYLTSQPVAASSGATDVVARCVIDARLAHVYDGDFLRAELYTCHDASLGVDTGAPGVVYLRLQFVDGPAVDVDAVQVPSRGLGISSSAVFLPPSPCVYERSGGSRKRSTRSTPRRSKSSTRSAWLGRTSGALTRTWRRTPR